MSRPNRVSSTLPTVGRRLIKLVYCVLALGLVNALGASPAFAEPGTRFDARDNPTADLQVGVDVLPGMWVGTNVEEYDYPGNCSIMTFRDYPPRYTEDGIGDWLISDIGQPMTYRVTPGGSVRFGRGCVWVWVGQ